jgi:hypothetical protein
MKTQLKKIPAYFIATAFLIAGATSCKKEVSTNIDNEATVATTATSSTIAVATDAAGSGGSASDSVYIINPCNKGTHRDSVAAATLPAGVQTYLSTNYSGYNFTKVFVVKDTTGTTKGYVVIINYNGKPVGLEFKADGTFVKVLEQREKADINNNGWHPGGRFENRNGQHKDTVAVSSLSSAITGYLTANYAGDTLVRAFKVAGGNYLVVTKNNGLFATLFTNTGVFVGRISLTAVNTLVAVADATLPSNALGYLNTTYPNYVLGKAVSVSISGTLKGYIAVIDANNTKYCVAFDANGSFVAVKTIW